MSTLPKASRQALAAVALAILVQLAPALFLGRPIGVSDIVETYAPWRVDGAPPPANPLLDDTATGLHPWMASLLRHGELLATPSVGAGSVGPLAGLFGVLSPFVLLPFALLPRSLALTGMALLDLVVAFSLFFLWRTRRGDAPTAAAIGAAIWAFAPARTVYRTWPHAGILALLPLLLLCADGLVDAPAARPDRRALAFAGLTVLLVLGGHPSFALLGVVTATAYGIARAMRRRSLSPRAVTASLLGVLLAALALAPTLALGRSFLASGEWLLKRAPIAEAPRVPWRVLLLLFDPSFYGDPVQGNWRGLGWSGPDNLVELQLYMGLFTLLLAPLGLGSRRREALFFAALGGLSLAAFVVGGPFSWAARLLPGVGTIFLSRLRVLTLFAAAVLASLGTAVLLGRIRRPPWLGSLLLLVVTLDLSLATQRFDPFPATPDGPPRGTPALARLRALAPGNGHRFLGFGNAVPPNVSFDLDLEDVRAHLLFSAGYQRLLTHLDPGVYGRHGTFLTFEAPSFRPEAAVLDQLGVAALIAPPGTQAPGGDFTLDRAGPDADVYRRPWTPPARLEPAGHVARFEADRTRWRLTTESAGPARLVLGRARVPFADRVTVDGLAVELDEGTDGLLALDLPAGRHAVAVGTGLPLALRVLSATGLLGILAVALSSLRGRGPRATLSRA